jgi:hypothetical protein
MAAGYTFLIEKLRGYGPRFLADARHKETAQRALDHVERGLVVLRDGGDIDDVRALDDGEDAPHVEELDRDDVAELLRLADDCLAGRQEMLGLLESGKERIVRRAADPAAATRWVDDTRAYLTESEADTKREIAGYREMLASGAETWTFTKLPRASAT